MSTTWLTLARSLMVFALLGGFLCCAQPSKRIEPQPPDPSPARELSPPPSKPEPRPYVHKVRYSGEILISIAEWYTGSRNNWTVIAKANPGLDPNRIFIGDTILIPENLLKRRDPMPNPTPYSHTVRWRGENISVIAQWYTGSRKNWKTIAKANPKINSNHIIVGDKIIIPENLLKRRDPMPPDFLINTSRKEPAQKPPPKKPSTEPDAIELFKPEIAEQPPADSDTIPLFGPIE